VEVETTTADERAKLIPDVTTIMVVGMLCAVVMYCAWCLHDQAVHKVDRRSGYSAKYDVRYHQPEENE